MEDPGREACLDQCPPMDSPQVMMTGAPEATVVMEDLMPNDGSGGAIAVDRHGCRHQPSRSGL